MKQFFISVYRFIEQKALEVKMRRLMRRMAAEQQAMLVSTHNFSEAVVAYMRHRVGEFNREFGPAILFIDEAGRLGK